MCEIGGGVERKGVICRNFILKYYEYCLHYLIINS